MGWKGVCGGVGGGGVLEGRGGLKGGRGYSF